MLSPNSDETLSPAPKRFKVADHTLWVVFDLETTGFHRLQHNIVKIAAIFLDDNGKALDDGSFLSLVKPSCCIPHTTTALTGITQQMVAQADNFSVVGNNFLDTISSMRAKMEDDSGRLVTQIVLVAHNGK